MHRIYGPHSRKSRRRCACSRFRSLLTAVALVAFFGSLTAASCEEIPANAYLEDGTIPLWRSLADAFASNDEEALTIQSSVATLAKESAAGECVRNLEDPDHIPGQRPGGPNLRNDPATAFREADSILLAHVIDAAPGLARDRFGTLLLIRAKETLKGTAELPSKSGDFFYFYPGLEIALGDQNLCLRRPGDPAPPREGDEILVFLRHDDLWFDSYSFSSLQNPFFVVPKGSLALSPPWIGAQAPEAARMTRGDLLEWARRYLRSTSKVGPQ